MSTPHIDGLKYPGILAIYNYDEALGAILKSILYYTMENEGLLSRPEKEFLACYASTVNSCLFSMELHKNVYEQLTGESIKESVSLHAYKVSVKLRNLCTIVKDVCQMNRVNQAKSVWVAKKAGVLDKEIFEAVAIGSLFCMVNRMVDMLNTNHPKRENFYESAARHVVAHGYL
jgi:hypothetical protein